MKSKIPTSVIESNICLVSNQIIRPLLVRNSLDLENWESFKLTESFETTLNGINTLLHFYSQRSSIFEAWDQELQINHIYCIQNQCLLSFNILGTLMVRNRENSLILSG